ncbi:MAG: 5'/3'-nucleotidase SurE [Acidimicrobiales bacterium]
MEILVTNDDGIDSVGLHVLARAMRDHGKVTIVAPDREFSGASGAIGALHLQRPDVHQAHVEGIDESWSVSGPPALCVMFARMGAFDKKFDLVVAGTNPGVNVGRAVYMSGTVGAALGARLGGISGVAVSQATESWGIEGQGYEEMLVHQKWDTAATIASAAVGGLLAQPASTPQVLNINLPNEELDDLKGVRETTVGSAPPRRLGEVKLLPRPGHEGSFNVEMNWGEVTADEVDPHSDVGAVMAGYVSVTMLTQLREAGFPHDDRSTAAIAELLIN